MLPLRLVCRLSPNQDCRVLSEWAEVVNISEMQARGVNVSILWADMVSCEAPKETKYRGGGAGVVTELLDMPETSSQFQCLLKSMGIFSNEHWSRLMDM